MTPTLLASHVASLPYNELADFLTQLSRRLRHDGTKSDGQLSRRLHCAADIVSGASAVIGWAWRIRERESR